MDYHRRTIRLKQYDYSEDGFYFVTICTQNRENLFGEITGGIMKINYAGEIIKKWYTKSESKFANIKCGEYVIMPNHFHCIMEFVGADPRVCPESPENNECTQIQGEHMGSPLHKTPLPQIIQWFKTMTTNEYIKMIKQNLLPSFDKRVWQRNYHEHIIRNEAEYYRIIEYIKNNPVLWENDCYNSR